MKSLMRFKKNGLANLIPLGLALAGLLVACPPTPHIIKVATAQPLATLLQIAVSSSVTFKATNENNAPVEVNWSITPATGSGSIDSSGTFVSPSTVPADPKVIIKATSKATPSDFGTLTVTIVGQGTVGISGAVTVPDGLLTSVSDIPFSSSVDTARVIQKTVSDWNAPHVNGQVLIVGNNTRLASAKSLNNLTLRDVGSGISSVKVPAGENDQAFATRVALETGLIVQPDYIYRPLGDVPNPNDPKFVDQFYLTQIDAQGAWAVQRDVPDGLIAIIDSGVLEDHPDLQGRYILGKDFCVTLPDTGCEGEDNDPADLPTTVIQSGHGTGVMGLIAATSNNTIGITGLSWGGKALIIKVFAADSGNFAGTTTPAIAKAVRYAADQGAKVINMSLGIALSAGATDATLDAALDYAAAKGVVMIAASGNSNDATGVYYPARNAKVIAVGSVDKTNAISSFSARGSELDIVAPGEGIPGNPTTAILTTSVNGTYQTNTGTSEAAPQVAAVAGLIRAKNPSLTADQVKGILTSTAKNLGAANTFGAGLIQAGAALRKTENPSAPPVPKTTVYIYADPCVAGGSGAACTQYGDGSNNSTGRVVVELNGKNGAVNYTLTLARNGMSALPAGTYRIVACVNKNANAIACDAGDLGGNKPAVVYDGTTPVTGINVTLSQLN